MDITEFLSARFDEEHADAIAARDKHTGMYAVEGDAEWRVSDSGEGIYTEQHGIVVVIGSFGSLDDETANHIARHDPARVLADVKAKRAIVALHAPMEIETSDVGGDPWAGTVCYACEGGEGWPCTTLRHLAAIHADHPDCNPAWAVS